MNAAAHARQHRCPKKGPLTGRARVPARRKGVVEANGIFSPSIRGRLWASGTVRQPPDEDAIPPQRRVRRRLRSAEIAVNIGTLFPKLLFISYRSDRAGEYNTPDTAGLAQAQLLSQDHITKHGRDSGLHAHEDPKRSRAHLTERHHLKGIRE